MKIYCVSSPAAEWLCNGLLLPSISSVEPDTEVTVARCPIAGNGDFMSENFKLIVLWRLEHIVKWIKSNMGSRIFVSDVDILYLRPFKRVAEDVLNGCDVAFQREGLGRREVNVGQMAIRCSQSTLEFFCRAVEDGKRVLQSSDESNRWVSDQNVINRLLNSGMVSYRTLPPSFSNTNIGYSAQMISFHAISTSPAGGLTSMQRKFQRMQALKMYLDSISDESSARAGRLLAALRLDAENLEEERGPGLKNAPSVNCLLLGQRFSY